MTTKVELITPKIATEILEKHNPRNRTISESTVAAYSTDMKNNRWTLTHQGLAFDENGDLIDGQHRLWAVFFANKEIEFNVTRGIPVKQQKGGVEINSMDNIDNGRVRTNGSQMQLSHEIKNGATMSGTCRSIGGICTEPNGKARGRMSMGSSMFIWDQYGKDIQAVFNALDPQHRRAYLLAPLAMYHHGEVDEAMEFCRQVATLESMSAPVRVLIKFLEAKHTSADTGATIRMVAKCIHAFHDRVDKVERFNDDNTGLKYLLAMYPSMNKRIADQLKPAVALRIPRKLTSKGKAFTV